MKFSEFLSEVEEIEDVKYAKELSDNGIKTQSVKLKGNVREVTVSDESDAKKLKKALNKRKSLLSYEVEDDVFFTITWKDGINRVNESEELNEAINAQKVLDYYISTMKNIEKFGKFYGTDKSKMERRFLSDYAGNDKKLKEIYKQITKMANTLDSEMTDLERIIG